MKKPMVVSILHELSAYRQQLPEELNELISTLEQKVQTYSDQHFEAVTDHAVSMPAGEQPVRPNAPDRLVNALYNGLNDYVQSRHGDADSGQLQSILSRLRGQVSTYDRDFP